MNKNNHTLSKKRSSLNDGSYLKQVSELIRGANGSTLPISIHPISLEKSNSFDLPQEKEVTTLMESEFNQLFPEDDSLIYPPQLMIESSESPLSYGDIDIIAIKATEIADTKKEITLVLTDTLLYHARRPILIVPYEVQLYSIPKIVYIVDFISEESFSIAFLMKMAKVFNAELLLLFIKDQFKNHQIDDLKEVIQKSPFIDHKVVMKTVEKKQRLLDDLCASEKGGCILCMNSNLIDFFYENLKIDLLKQLLFKKQIPLLTFRPNNFDKLIFG